MVLVLLQSCGSALCLAVVHAPGCGSHCCCHASLGSHGRFSSFPGAPKVSFSDLKECPVDTVSPGVGGNLLRTEQGALWEGCLLVAFTVAHFKSLEMGVAGKGCTACVPCSHEP